MSPIQAMERSYSALKQMLREGHYAPGARLEANRLAEELGVSMTPVRDVLHRLVGERLVEASSGEGFHVPRHSEAGLRDLYEWHSALILIAIRTTRIAGDLGIEPNFASTADLTQWTFEQIASGAPNREVRAAVASAGDRLHPFRMLEPQVLEPVIGELEELMNRSSGQTSAIRRYHLRRMRAVGTLLEAQNVEPGSRL
ncbi:MAG: GntR family transcriptional regulator [Pseudomonadota bacterium]